MAFTQKTLDFLMENKLRDDKEWYDEHKPEYKELVIKPMAELVEALTPTMLTIDSKFIVQPRVDRTISRIRRDTRFSKDKSKYRENCWLVFMREKKLYNGLPAFYFDLNPAGFGYGMGYYQASRETMDIIRQMIMGGEPKAKKAIKAFNNQDIFQLYGEEYKRAKFPDAPEKLQPWLNKKGISVNTDSTDMEMLFSDDLAEFLAQRFLLLVPIYDFFCAAEARRTDNK